MSGNLVPITKSDDEQLNVKFRPFTENRLSFAVIVPDSHRDAAGRMSFMQEPKASPQSAISQSIPVCNLNVILPEFVPDASSVSLHIDSKEMWSKLFLNLLSLSLLFAAVVSLIGDTDNASVCCSRCAMSWVMKKITSVMKKL